MLQPAVFHAPPTCIPRDCEVYTLRRSSILLRGLHATVNLLGDNTPTDMHIYPQRMSLQGLEVEILKLVSYSASPEQWKEWLRVPLEHAAARGNLELLNKLLEAGADGSDGWRGCRNRTLLDAAAVGGNEEVVSALLLAGAQPDINVVSASPKRSALYTATVLGHEAIARCLLVAGANVNFHDPVSQSSVLFEATRGGHRRLATELLIGGADPDCRSRYGNPLHVAAYNGLYGVVSTLLLRGADKDALDNDGGTPLMWASKQGHVSVVKILLARGADVRVRDTEQISALDRAAMSGYGDVVDVIAGHGTDVNVRIPAALPPFTMLLNLINRVPLTRSSRLGPTSTSLSMQMGVRLFRLPHVTAEASQCLRCCSTERRLKFETMPYIRHCMMLALGVAKG